MNTCATVKTRIMSMLATLLLSSCVVLSPNYEKSSTPIRPESFDTYYSKGRSYTNAQEIFTQKNRDYSITRFRLGSDAGPLWIDYFKGDVETDFMVFVFPVLGGKAIIENYFADYFASRGIDTAIVHRNDEFKKPENFDNLETLFRRNLIRDRIAIDFFEERFHKKKFGSFGISRGAINVAMTAGVDSRLEYNVLAMGGTDVVGLFRDSDQRRIVKYVDQVTTEKGISRDEMFQQLESMLKTDPKSFAHYLDPKKTLLILGAFDSTVPFKYGMKLREQIGNPRTVVLFGNHYTSLLFTQMLKVFPPEKRMCVFPFDYVENQALNFYDDAFGTSHVAWHLAPIKLLQIPLNLIVSGFQEVSSWFDNEEKSSSWQEPGGADELLFVKTDDTE